MSTENVIASDGGAAFPHRPERHERVMGDIHIVHPGDHPGMSVRDWFAGQALAGLLAAPADAVSQDLGPNARRHPDIAADAAYMIADAMLRVREKPRQA